MSFRDILVSWTTWSKLTGNADDDWVDRLNHIYTVVLQVVFAMFVVGGAYVMDTIACWFPAQFTAHMVKYTLNTCWIQNTYFIPMAEHLPRGDTTEYEITYYQYVPLILLCSALLFKFPSLVWRGFSSFSGIDIHKVVEMTAMCHYVDNSKREEKVTEIVCCLDRWLEATRQYHWNFLVRLRQKLSFLCFCLNRREGTYLTGLYVITKILFAVNVIGQFFLLDAFLGGFYGYWGIEALTTLATEHRLKESRRFPRITYCDFEIRLAKIEKRSVQCVMPMNLYNEKIFLFLWFWYVFVAAVTIGSVFIWIWRTLNGRNRVTFIKRYLKMRGRLQTAADKKLCMKFIDFLRADGVFLIQILQKNAQQILVADIVNGLWDLFLEKPIVKKIMSDPRTLANNNKGDAKPSYV